MPNERTIFLCRSLVSYKEIRWLIGKKLKTNIWLLHAYIYATYHKEKALPRNSDGRRLRPRNLEGICPP